MIARPFSVLLLVNLNLLEPGSSIPMHNTTLLVLEILSYNSYPIISIMKVEKAPLELYDF